MLVLSDGVLMLVLLGSVFSFFIVRWGVNVVKGGVDICVVRLGAWCWS